MTEELHNVTCFDSSPFLCLLRPVLGCRNWGPLANSVFALAATKIVRSERKKIF